LVNIIEVFIKILAPKCGLLILIVKYPNTSCTKLIRDAAYILAVFTCKGEGHIELEP
jgi:hypothetical protein